MNYHRDCLPFLEPLPTTYSKSKSPPLPASNVLAVVASATPQSSITLYLSGTCGQPSSFTSTCQNGDHVVLGQPSHFPCHLSNSFQNALDVDKEMLDEVVVASTNCLDAKET